MSENFEACSNEAANNKACTCPNTGCPRHGICCQCVAHHLNMGNVCQCFVKAGIK